MPKTRGINHLLVVKALEKAGFWVARQGKHIEMTNGERIVTIPRHKSGKFADNGRDRKGRWFN